MSNKFSGIAVATAAAALFASGTMMAPLAHAADEGKVQCAGVNSCKGHSECASAKNSCKGQNGCKGQGWVHAKDKAECEKMGGKVVMSDKTDKKM